MILSTIILGITTLPTVSSNGPNGGDGWTPGNIILLIGAITGLLGGIVGVIKAMHDASTAKALASAAAATSAANTAVIIGNHAATAEHLDAIRSDIVAVADNRTKDIKEI